MPEKQTAMVVAVARYWTLAGSATPDCKHIEVVGFGGFDDVVEDSCNEMNVISILFC